MHNINDLFAQRGLASDDASIAHFIQLRRALVSNAFIVVLRRD